MIKVGFVEPETPDWARWRAKCVRKTESIRKAVAAGAAAPVVGNLYREQKAAIAAAFSGKCAFCEKRITSTQWGDVEHYRPKAAVQGEDWAPAQLSRGGRTGLHPGYWWLAYDPANLLLSCIQCNQVAKGRAYGKGNRFPVAGFRAEEPGEEGQEDPMLLHPCRDDPADHIAFDETGGCSAIGGSEKGRATIDILGLNERELPSERAERYKFVKARLDLLLINRPPNWLQEIDQMQGVSAEFSAVARMVISQVLKAILPVYEVANVQGK